MIAGEQGVSVKNQETKGPINQAPKEAHIMKRFPVDRVKDKSTILLIIGSILIVLAGIGTGWFLSGGGVLGTKGEAAVSKQKTVDIGDGVVEIGEAGEEADEAEGKLEVGGLQGEGTHRLEREGGPSQTVCLTSTVIDLQGFVGKKVKIWGETISPISCPWLMDVVKIKEIE